MLGKARLDTPLMICSVPTPEFVSVLRQLIGHRPLWLSAAIGVVLDPDDRILLVRSSSTAEWTLPGGIIDPAEAPADAVVREVLEETGVLAEPEVLTCVSVSAPTTYPNGDKVQFLDLTFRCRALGGDAKVNDTECMEVGWFSLHADPGVHDHCKPLLEATLQCTGPAAFSFSGKRV